MFNGFRLNGVAFNAYFSAALFNSAEREPDFRQLLVREQSFTLAVPAERDRLSVKADNLSIKVRNDA